MGNSKSFNLTAGIQVEDRVSSDGTPGIRHRNSPKANLCASIVEVESGAFSAMENAEKELLEKMNILDGDKVRLSCKARVTAEDSSVDLNFQEKYDPSTLGF